MAYLTEGIATQEQWSLQHQDPHESHLHELKDIPTLDEVPPQQRMGKETLTFQLNSEVELELMYASIKMETWKTGMNLLLMLSELYVWIRLKFSFQVVNNYIFQ